MNSLNIIFSYSLAQGYLYNKDLIGKKSYLQMKNEHISHDEFHYVKNVLIHLYKFFELASKDYQHVHQQTSKMNL